MSSNFFITGGKMLNTNKKIPIFLISFLLLLCCWGVVTFFTVSWDLPSHFTPETDGISSKLDLSAREMMKADTCKYPPLQYLIVSAFTGKESEKGLSSGELLHKRSRRIVIMRLVSSFMGLGTALTLAASLVQSKNQDTAMKETVAKEVAEALKNQMKES